MLTSEFYVFMILTYSAVRLGQGRKNSDKQTQFIQEFSSLYSNKFVVLIKPDNETDERLSELIKIRNILTRSLTFYTSINDFTTFFNYLKPDDIRHLGMTTVYTHIDSIKIPELNTMMKVRYNAIFTFLCEIPSNESIPNLRDVYAPIDSKFFLVNWLEEARVEILEYYNLPRSDEQEVRHFGEWNDQDGLTVEEKDLTKRRENLKGVVTRYMNSNRADCCKHESVVSEYLCMFECFNLKLWMEMGKRFNFTTKHLYIESPHEVSDFVSQLAAGECESGTLSLIINTKRMNKIRFMWPLYKTRVCLMTAVAGSEISMSSFLKPCSGEFWVALAAWLTVAGVILVLLNYAVNHVVYHSITTSAANFDTFQIPFQAICSQACIHETSWSGIRIVLFMCYTMPVIFLSAYSGRIISSLAKPERIPFRNLKEFEKNTEYRLASYKNSYFISVLETNSLFDNARKESLLLENMPKDTREAFADLCTKKVTLVTELPAVAVNPPKCSAYFLDDTIGEYFGTMAITPHFPFVEPLTRYIQKTATSGIRLKNLYKIGLNTLQIELPSSASELKRRNPRITSIEPASLDNLTLLFTLLFFGIGLSVAVFLLEVWHMKGGNKEAFNIE